MRRILTDAGLTGASHLVTAISQLGLQVFAIRNIPPAAYGSYVTAVAIVTLIEAIFVARSGELTLRYTVPVWLRGEFGAAKAYANQITRLDIVLNCTLCTALIAFAVLGAPQMGLHSLYIATLALILPFQISYGSQKGLLIASSKLDQLAILEIAVALIHLVTGLLFVSLWGVFGLVGALLVGTLGKTIGAKLLACRLWPSDLTHLDATDVPPIRFLAHGGAASLARQALICTTQQIDILLLTLLQGPHTVAIYKVAKTIATLPIRLASPMWAVVRPHLITLWAQQDRSGIFRQIVPLALLCLSSLVVGLSASWWLLDDVIVLLFGSSYNAATQPMILLLVGNWLFGAVTGWFGFWLIISHADNAGLLVYGCLLAFMLLGGWLTGSLGLIPYAAAMAAAMALASVFAWVVFVVHLRLVPVVPNPTARLP